MTAKVTVLGCSGTYPANGNACSSYLVDDGRSQLLLDAGNGSLARLTQVVDITDIDGVVLSHLHPDHFVDLVAMAYALRFHPSGPLEVDVWAPAGAEEMLTRHLDDDSKEKFGANVRVHEIGPGTRVSVGDISLQTFDSNHPANAMSVRVEAGGAVVAYSGDTGGSDELVECARDADLFICDATWTNGSGPHPPGLHLTGEEAGRHAARARARRLLITHVSPYESPEQVAAEASAVYDGETLIAEDLQEHVL